MKAALMVAGPTGGSWDISEVQRPVVPPGHVLLRVHASSINRAEFRRLNNLRLRAGPPRSRGSAAATRRARSSSWARASPGFVPASGRWGGAAAGLPNTRSSTRAS